jgi:hypothetical protein
MQIEPPATNPVFPIEDGRSPAPRHTAMVSGAGPCRRPPVVLGDIVYASIGAGRVAGFAEPARDPGPEAPGREAGVGDEHATAADAFVGMSLAEVERIVIEATIRASGGSLPKAARVLGVSPSTLYRKRARWAD